MGKENRILQGARQALAYAEGRANVNEYVVHVPADVDVAAIRRKLGLSQVQFSRRFGFKPASVKDWEQRRSSPTGPIRAYLRVIEKNPEAVQRALAVR
jgi:putative transcriptional regulator